MMSFLKAEWRKLLMVNYSVDQEILTPYLPFGTELDVWKGNCYVSLVGFLFKNVRLLGIAVPFHTNFEEVNLRFYVRFQDRGVWKRGVVFIKEIVPKYALSFVANAIYNENYETQPMKYRWEYNEESLLVEYNWKPKGHWQKITASAENDLSEIPLESETEFITEHYWGYSKYTDKITNEYEVRHPQWKQYAVRSYNIDVDFALNYGERFKFLNNIKPTSVFLAEGSEVSIERKKVIK
jgi:uncharacterized protein YqjF (DUF2071 family)